MSLGTVPKVAIHEPNKTLKVVTDFLEALRVSQHKAIFDTYRYYNAQGGRVLTLQSSNQVQYTHVFICGIYDIMRWCNSASFSICIGLLSKGNHISCLGRFPCSKEVYPDRYKSKDVRMCHGNNLCTDTTWCFMYIVQLQLGSACPMCFTCRTKMAEKPTAGSSCGTFRCYIVRLYDVLLLKCDPLFQNVIKCYSM